MNFVHCWQKATRLMRVAPLVFGMAPFLATAAISAQEATPGAGTACQGVIEHDVAAQTQRLFADCVDGRDDPCLQWLDLRRQRAHHLRG